MDISKRIEEDDLKLSSYDYKLDSKYIAQFPVDTRDQSRMMVVNRNYLDNSYLNLHTENLKDFISKGDLVIANNTKVMKARLRVTLNNGKSAEILILEPIENSLWLCLAKPAKKMKLGDVLKLDKGGKDTIYLKIINNDFATGGRIVQFPSEYNDRFKMYKLLEEFGEVPLPPYIRESHNKNLNEERYQTIYANQPGAVAAPTAGLHLSEKLIKDLLRKGVKIVYITLHVGYGTFKPIDKENLQNLSLHEEWAEVKSEVVEAIIKCKKKGSKVYAIGTTSVRAIESSFSLESNELKPITGNINLVIKPGYSFKAVDGLLTNFHLPKSSLLLLVSAMIGRKRLLNFYQEAINQNYRFFSYGDAMLIRP
tara:strand:+ start:15118 stop:16218 length:1101 start_codon:yes stop_codon:yes gene_type:complete